MTANDAVPPIRLDRYLALLALLLASVLGFVVLGERQKAALRPVPVTGPLPPPDARLAHLAGERDRLLVEQARLTAGLATARQALATAEADVERLEKQVAGLERDLTTEAEARTALERQLAEMAAERDRLAVEVRSITRIRERLAAELAALMASQAPPSAPATTPPPATDLLPGPSLTPDTRAGQAPAGDRGGRLVILDGRRTAVADGIKAYQAGDYDEAARLWSRPAAEGEVLAQFHLGSLLLEGRTGPPDRVMAYVWLSRAVAGGHLPAIEMRRRARAAMTDEEYASASAILGAG